VTSHWTTTAGTATFDNLALNCAPSQSTTVTSRSFHDGLGDLGETRSPSPGGQDVVRYSYYDVSQRLVLQSVPYLVTAYTGGPGPAAYSIPDSTQSGTTTTYDTLGRVLTTTDALSNQSRRSYSVVCGAAGTDAGCYEDTLSTDANGHRSGTLVDGAGRTAYVQRYTGNSTIHFAVYATAKYTYDLAGDLVKITQPDGTTTTSFAYDMAGRKTSLSDPDLGAQSYTYDQDGNLVQSVDARGSAGTVFMGYDGLDLLGRQPERWLHLRLRRARAADQLDADGGQQQLPAGEHLRRRRQRAHPGLPGR
jgi:YD repeat-containing protein